MFIANFKNKGLLIPLVFLAWLANGLAQNLSPDLAPAASRLSNAELPFVELKKGSNLPADGHEATEKQVHAITESLAEKIGKQKFRIWFKNSTKFSLTGDYLKVGYLSALLHLFERHHDKPLLRKLGLYHRVK